MERGQSQGGGRTPEPPMNTCNFLAYNRCLPLIVNGILEVLFIFEVVLIFEVIFIFDLVFIFEVILVLEVFFNCQLLVLVLH